MTVLSDADILYNIKKNKLVDFKGEEESYDFLKPKFFQEKYVQPASLELPIKRVWSVNGSISPPVNSSRIKELTKMGVIVEELVPDSENNVFINERHTYIAEHFGELRIPEGFEAFVDTKSSFARIFLDVVAKGNKVNNKLSEDHEGSVYSEIYSSHFPIKLKIGSTINQLRFTDGNRLNNNMLTQTYGEGFYICDREGKTIEKKEVISGRHLILNADITHGWKTIPSAVTIDTSKNNYDPREYFEILKPRYGKLTIDENASFILATVENIVLFPEYAGYLERYSRETNGRALHYGAGFGDPGFGYNRPREKRKLDEVCDVIEKLKECGCVELKSFEYSLGEEFNSTKNFYRILMEEKPGERNKETKIKGASWTLESTILRKTLIEEHSDIIQTKTEIEKVGVDFPVLRPYGSGSLESHYQGQVYPNLPKFFDKKKEEIMIKSYDI